MYFTNVKSPAKRKFLGAYAETGNISKAAELSKQVRQNHYVWLKNDPEYVKAFDEAREIACDRLEEEARRRAVNGTLKPVFYKGEECGVIREYSDNLLMFIMKGNMPDKYKDRVANEHTGTNGGPIVVKLPSELE
jgi:uncharacterized protein YbjQ (UPF0145 family)